MDILEQIHLLILILVLLSQEAYYQAVRIMMVQVHFDWGLQLTYNPMEQQQLLQKKIQQDKQQKKPLVSFLKLLK